MCKYLFLFFLVLSGFAAFAQKDLRPGFIITLQGDTLQGKVRDRSDARNNKSVAFLGKEGGAVKEYAPDELRGYGITGRKMYFSENITTIKQTDQTEDTVETVVFLQQLVKGPFNLFYLAEVNVPDRFFLSQGEGPLTELIQSKKLVKKEYGTYLQTLNFYQETLRDAFAQCPSVAAKAYKAAFSIQSISKVVLAYNACATPAATDFVSETVGRKTSVVLTGTLGYAVGNMTVPKDNNLLRNPEGRNGLAGGVSVDIQNTGFSKVFSLQLGVDYMRKGADGNFSYKSGSRDRHIHTSINPQTLSFSGQVRVNKNLGKWHPYVGAGPLFGYIMNHETAYSFNNRNNAFPPTNTEFGFVVETGVLIPMQANKNGLALSFRFENSHIDFNYTSTGTFYNHYFRLGLGYWIASGK